MSLRTFLTSGILKAALTSGVLYGIGDAMAQLVVEPYAENKRRSKLAKETPVEPVETTWDPRRTSNFAIAGFIFHGPYFSRIYLVLDAYWPHLPSTASISRRLLTGLKKSLATNIFFGPPFLIGFLAFVSALEGLNWSEIKTKVNRLGPMLFTDGLKAWPLASALNFTFTPPQYRLAVVNVIGAFWNSYVSVRNADKVSFDEGEELSVATSLGAEMIGMASLDHVASKHEVTGGKK
jgi:protein Mpv17